MSWVRLVSNNQHWYEIKKIKDYLYLIRERLDEIDPRFYTTYSNLYLVLGSHSALLIDTGCGLFPLKPFVDDLIGDKALKVINSHSHFDHRGGNTEFETILIHEKEVGSISKPMDISFLQDSPKQIVEHFKNMNFVFQPADNIKALKEGNSIDLGDISIKIFHTPGHSPGSISILTNRNDLFTGDTAHYGAMYLSKNEIPTILMSILRLLELFEKDDKIEIFPSHEDFAVGKELLIDLYSSIQNIESLWGTKKRDDFLEGWVIEDSDFKYIIFE